MSGREMDGLQSFQTRVDCLTESLEEVANCDVKVDSEVVIFGFAFCLLLDSFGMLLANFCFR